MARLTVEDKWWIDPRRSFLMGRIKNPEAVDGIMVGIWRLAQQYWSDGERLIPWRVFSKFSEHLNVLEADLTELRDCPQHTSSKSPARVQVKPALSRSLVPVLVLVLVLVLRMFPKRKILKARALQTQRS